MSQRPLCFVLLPFGIKIDPSGGPNIDFDNVYKMSIQPAIINAGLEPIRANDEQDGGTIHGAMFEQLLLCEFAIVDLTCANPNVFYEFGIRHALRPYTTLSIYAKHQFVPFDVAFVHALPYEFDSDGRFSSEVAEKYSVHLTERLSFLRNESHNNNVTDSPVFHLISDLRPPEISHLKTDSFRDRVEYSKKIKQEIAQARASGSSEAIRSIEDNLENTDGVDSGVIIDLFLSYRAVSDWESMIGCYERMPKALQQQVMIQEQLGFALNRYGKKQQAIEVLENAIDKYGASAETCGILGRVYKDLWVDAADIGEYKEAIEYLDKAIATYIQGFEADWRDAYPGINAVTLLDIRGTKETLSQKKELLPVVRYSVSQRLKTGSPSYWDYATMVELAVLANDEAAAIKYLSTALANAREKFEPKTTANNIRLIYQSRQKRRSAEQWISGIINELVRKAVNIKISR